MFLKRNLARFNFPTEMYSTEVRIYRDVLPGLGVESPAVYAIEAADDDVGFTILMEDLAQRPGARLGHRARPRPRPTRSTACSPPSPGSTPRAGASDARRPPAAVGHGSGRQRRHAVLGRDRPPADRRHLRAGPPGRRSSTASSWPEDELWSALRPHGRGRRHTARTRCSTATCTPATCTTCDGGRTGGLLDWQLVLRGCWALDVTYLLITALEHRRPPRPTSASCWRLSRPPGGARASTPPSADEAWLRYRQNVLYGVLMWLITPDGVHTDEAQLLNLERCLTAGDELATLAALGR